MSTTLRNLTNIKAEQAIVQLNKLRLDLLRIQTGLIAHADASTNIGVATAAALPAVLLAANAAKVAYNAHVASVCDATSGLGAHLAADATNPTAVADATDQDTANALLNDIKAKYAAHRVLTSSHPQADATNTVTSADATNLATSITLANELVTKLNAHFNSALAFSATLLVSP